MCHCSSGIGDAIMIILRIISGILGFAWGLVKFLLVLVIATFIGLVKEKW